MSLFDQFKNSKQLWAITAIVVVLAGALSVAAYFLLAPPAEPVSGSQASESSLPEEDPSVKESSSGQEESQEEESSSEEEEPSSAPAGSTVTTPTSRPTASTTPSVTPSYPQASAPVTALPSYQDGVINQAGLYAASGSYRNLTIDVGSVSLQNKTITGNLTLSSNIGQGDVTLSNLQVDGTIYVYGGYNLVLDNVRAAGIVFARATGSNYARLEGDTLIDLATVKSHVTLDGTGLENRSSSGILTIFVEEGNRLWQDVTLKSLYTNKITVNAPTNLTVDGSSRVGQISAYRTLHLMGRGDVAKLYAAADDITYEYRPDSIETKSGYNTPEHGGSPIGAIRPTSNDSSDDDDTTTLSAPTGLSMAVDQAAGQVTASWEAVDHASGYRVVPVVDGEKQAAVTVEADVLSAVIYTLPAPQEVSLYFTVQALGEGDYLNSRASTSVTKALSTLAAPQVKLELDAAAEQFNAQWEAVPQAAAYTVTTTIYRDGQQLGGVSTRTVTACQLSAYTVPAEAGEYKVELSVVAQSDSDWITDSPAGTQSAQVTRLASPGTFEVELKGGDITASWSKATGAEGYEVIATINGEEGNPQYHNSSVTSSKLASYSADITSAQAQIVTIGNGKTTLDSAPLAKSLARQKRTAPTQVSIGRDGDRLSVTFTPSDASQYQVALYKDGVLQLQEATSSSSYVLTNASYTIDRLATGSSYQFKVTALGDGGMIDNSNATASDPVYIGQFSAQLKVDDSGAGTRYQLVSAQLAGQSGQLTLAFTDGKLPASVPVDNYAFASATGLGDLVQTGTPPAAVDLTGRSFTVAFTTGGRTYWSPVIAVPAASQP